MTRVLVNAFGAYAGGIVRVHDCVVREMARTAQVRVANQPRTSPTPSGVTVLSTQGPSRLKSVMRDWLTAAARWTRVDLRIDSAPAFRPFTWAKRHVVIVHDLNFLDRHIHRISTGQYLYRWVLNRWALARTDRVVVVSESTRAEVASFYPRAISKTQVLPLPVDHLHDVGSAHSQRADDARIKILSFAHAGNKGIGYLIDALRLRADFDLTVVCGASDWTTFWAAAARAADVEDRITVLTGLSDSALIREYHDASVFCMLSDYEGYGLPVAESLFLARPTVINDIDVLRTTGRGHAVAVTASNPESVIDGIDEAVGADTVRWTTAADEFHAWTWQQWVRDMADFSSVTRRDSA